MAESELRTITGVFRKDHEEVGRLLAALDFSTFGKALAGAEAFARRLERHMAWEEEVLFPAVGRAEPSLAREDLPVLRAEHARLRWLSAEVLGLLRERSPKAERRAAELCEFLAEHSAKEDALVYAAGDRALSPAEAGEVLAAVELSAARSRL